MQRPIHRAVRCVFLVMAAWLPTRLLDWLLSSMFGIRKQLKLGSYAE